MSYALTLFSVGATCAAGLLLLTGWYRHHLATTAIYLGGFWAMVPEVRHVVPYRSITEPLTLISEHPVSDFFLFHYTITARLGHTHTDVNHYVSAVFLIGLLIMLSTYTYVRHHSLAQTHCVRGEP